MIWSLFLTNTQLLVSQDVNLGTGVNYFWIIVMFISRVWTLILTAPIHCRRSIGEQAMLHFSKSDEETNSATSQMAWEWAHIQQIIIFRRTIPWFVYHEITVIIINTCFTFLTRLLPVAVETCEFWLCHLVGVHTRGLLPFTPFGFGSVFNG